MSWKASAYIKALVVCPNGERISRTEKLVALVLADSHQDKGKAHTYPAVKTIAEDSLMDARVCRRMLGALERKGVIVRERAENQGRGQLTFYRFPALDDELNEAELPPAATAQKGGRVVPLTGPVKGDTVSPFLLSKRRTEGGRKEDETATPPIGRTGTETNTSTTPPTPSSDEGDVMAIEPELERAVDQVCSALGISNRRKRKPVRLAIALAAEKGELPATIALGMITAVRDQDRLHLERRLKFKFGLQKFLGDGIWRDENRWAWDPAEMRLQAEARVGSR